MGNESPNKLAVGAEGPADGAPGLNWAQSTPICITGVSWYVYMDGRLVGHCCNGQKLKI